METDTPVVKLVGIVYDHACVIKTFSWRGLNSALHDTLLIAIDNGMRFRKNDFSVIAKKFKSGFWIGDGESMYIRAIDKKNISAAISYEKHRGRKPFIMDRVIRPDHKTFCKKRLSIGKLFMWEGKVATVTSFNDADGYLTACTYKYDEEYGVCTNRVKNRFKITHADLKEATHG